MHLNDLQQSMELRFMRIVPIMPPLEQSSLLMTLTQGINVLRIQEPVLTIRMEWPNERSRR
jgi:hypothetical protein